VIAPTQLLRVPAVVVEDFHRGAVVDLRSATSAPRLVTLLVTAQRLVATAVVDSVVNKAAMVAALVVDVVDKPATHAVVMVTCLVTALKVKSATTAARLVTCPETAHLRPAASEHVTNASLLAMFRLNALTKSAIASWQNTMRPTTIQ
jgi:hypothetical protein